MKKTCHKCGAAIPQGAKFCSECGAAVGNVRCENCQTENPPESKFCSRCGNPLEAAAKRENKGTQAPVKALSSRHMVILSAFALLGVIVTYVYYYDGFIKPLESKSAPPVGQSAQQEEPHDHSPSEEELQTVRAELQQNPNSAGLNTTMGNLLFDSGKFSEAIPYYQKAIELSPNNADVVVDLGVCYFNLGELEKAEENFQLALKTDGSHINALYNMGVVAAQMGDVNKLIHYWNVLQEVAPNSQQAQRAMQMLNEIHQNVDQFSGTESE